MTALMPHLRRLTLIALLAVSATADAQQGSVLKGAEQWLMIARQVVLLVLVVVCAYTDTAKGKIYNWVSFPALIAGLVLSYWQGGVLSGSVFGDHLVGSVLGMAIAGGILLWPYMKGGIGGGDLKLMAAVGALGGMKNMFAIYALFYASLVGAFMAIGLLIWKGRVVEGLKGTVRFIFRSRKPAETDSASEKRERLYVPYGLAISIGTILAWFLIYGIV